MSRKVIKLTLLAEKTIIDKTDLRKSLEFNLLNIVIQNIDCQKPFTCQ